MPRNMVYSLALGEHPLGADAWQLEGETVTDDRRGEVRTGSWTDLEQGDGYRWTV